MTRCARRYLEQDHILSVGYGLCGQKNMETGSAECSGMFVLAAKEHPGAVGTDFLAVQTSPRDHEDVAGALR